MHVQQAVDGEFRADGENNVSRRRELVAVQAKNLPDQPLDPVAPNRIAGLALHTDAQAIELKGIGQKNQTIPISPQPPAGFVDALEIPGCSQQMLFRKRAAIQAIKAPVACGLLPVFS